LIIGFSQHIIGSGLFILKINSFLSVHQFVFVALFDNESTLFPTL